MRKINNDFDDAPKLLLDCAKANESKLLDNKNVSSNCYKESRAKLEEQFNGKCAYCETKYLATSDTWIEHYRPKSDYYWLAYEWSNLLPTCTKCNRSKSNKFPLINEANKVKNPPVSDGKLDTSKCRADSQPLINEAPFVLHSKIDNPKNYFDFQLDENFTGIEIVGTDNVVHPKYKGRGDATIEICKLNRRHLKIARYKVVNEIIDMIFYISRMFEKSLPKYEKAFNSLFAKIKEKAKQPELEYTLLREIIIDENKFETIICPAIEDEKVREFIKMAYKKYRAKK